MFKTGQKGYIVEFFKGHKNIKIVECVVIGILNNQVKISKYDTDIIIADWACFHTEQDAYRFAILYLIQSYEFKTNINKTYINQQFNELEESNPQLIFKYMNMVSVG